MKLLPFLLALFFASCIGLPDRAAIEVGHGHGDGSLDGYKHDFGIDTESSWVAATLEFPISWRRPEERPQPIVIHVPQPVPIVTVPPPTPVPEPAPAPAPTETQPAAAVPPPGKEKVEEDKPWWEDFTLVQGLVLAAAGALAGRYGGAGVQKVRTLVKRAPSKPKPEKG